MIISLVNQKGGVGKTTLAINIGIGMARRNYKVKFLDTDPQGTASQWQSIEGNVAFEVRRHPSRVTLGEITNAGMDHNFLVIDTPPAIGEITQSVLELSDLAIVPLAPSVLDIWSSRTTIGMIEEAKRLNPKLEGRLLVSRKIPRTRLGRDGREAIAALEMEVFETEISQRIAYVESMIAGVSVFQYAPKSEASQEIESLCEEIIKGTAVRRV
ncbi:MAG: ParA family partition ATPase [Deltaproteobacteria bacterium]